VIDMENPGKVIGLFIGPPRSGRPLDSVNEVRAVADRGLEGDRYFDKAGTFSGKHGPDRQITLIESEAIDAVGRDYGYELAPAASRRNVVTRGIYLNHLVGREFRVGRDVVLKGLRLCEPCGHLAKLTSERVREGLVHRGGLRAQIVRGGTISVGDEIQTGSPE
jgi:MOSC domain-containing protein YiiM